MRRLLLIMLSVLAVTIPTTAQNTLACPEIELPSITGSKSSFRYIDAGCESSLTIRPSFGVSGGQITGYGVQSIPYNPPFPFNMGTQIFIDQDDVWGDVISLPFKFCFFDNTYTKAVVGANGLVSFNTSVANQPSAWSLELCGDIPSTTFLGEGGRNWGNAIYGVFEDIDPNKIYSQSTQGSIRYGILGEYPCRTLTVSWNKVPNYKCANGNKYWDSFQIVLYEGTNVIDVYVNHKSRCTTWNLGRGIIGIQNASCTKGIAAPNRNTTHHWTADREAWRFTPRSTPQYTITYYDGMGINGRVLGQGEQITVDPTEVDAITVRLEFTAANGDRFDLRDTAVIVHTQMQRDETTKVICEGGSYTWRGKTYTESGTYIDPVGGHAGCYDKIYQLNLTIDKAQGTKETQSICEGQKYRWHGEDYRQEGTYYHRYSSSEGCNLIDTLVLQVNTRYAFIERDTICEGEHIVWRGEEYATGGTYIDNHVTSSGCDSSYTLHLTVGRKYLFEYEDAICDGKTYKWRGRTYKTEGTYYDSLVSSLGCDSVYRLQLRVAQNYFKEEYDTICNGERYLWHGKTLKDPGTYYDSLQSADGCDSIHVLYLKVNRTYHLVDESALRSDGKYRWRGTEYTEPGQYYDSLKTKDGCDSVYQLNLTYLRSQLYARTEYLCEGSVYTWRRKEFSEPGVYYDSLTNKQGGDSVYQLTLIGGAPIYKEEHVSICSDGEPYEWFGQQLTQTDVYEHVVNRTSTDCGITYRLYLTVGEPFHSVTDGDVCLGKKYEWRGFEYSKPGVYYDEYKNAQGCDSIYQLNLRGCSPYFFPSEQTICEGGVCTWRGKPYTQAGVYYDSLLSVHGCDSVYQLTLHTKPLFLQTKYDTICEGSIYDWRGEEYDAAGVYYDSLRTAEGCDSVYVLHLATRKTYLTEESAAICEGQIHSWRGQRLTQTDTYYDRLTTHDGCDSVFVLYLTVNPTYSHVEQDYICGGETYYWEGDPITQAGLYTKTLSASLGGCDSIVQLNLGVGEKYYFEEEYSACDSSVYSWHHQEITKSGVYWDSLLTVHGCDSVYRLEATFHPVFHFVTEATICQGDSFLWRDSVYAIDSIYFDELSTAYECDSLYELRLTVLPSYTFYDTLHFCNGKEVEWRSMKLTEPGTYWDSLQTRSLCDSIYQLSLLIEQVYHAERYDTICSGESLVFDGKTYTEEGDYSLSYPTAYGCDSVFTIHLHVRELPKPTIQKEVCADENYILIHCQPWIADAVNYSLVFSDQAREQGFADRYEPLLDTLISIPMPDKAEGTFVDPDQYHVVLSLWTEACAKPTEYDLSFQVLYPSYVVIQKFNDVLAVLNEHYNGGYTFSAYQWYADGAPLEGAVLPYYYGNGMLSGSYYQVLLTRDTDGKASMTCPIIPITNEQSPISNNIVYPCTMKVYRPEGSYVSEHYLHSPSDIVDVERSMKDGVYLLLFSEPQMGTKATKLMIR